MLTSVFSKIVPIFSRILPILSKIAGPLAAVAGAGVMGYKIGQKLDKMLGISDKIDSTLDKTHKEASLQAKELSEKQSVMLKKALGGILPSEKGFKAKRQVKMQTLIGRGGEERSKDLGFFGRSNMVAIDTAQRNFMNKNIGSYLQYSYDDIANLRQEWLKGGGHGGKIAMQDPAKYGRNREASFLSYLQKNAKPLSETQVDDLYQTYETGWKKSHKVRGAIIDKVQSISTKSVELKDIAVTTGVSVAEKVMGIYKEKNDKDLTGAVVTEKIKGIYKDSTKFAKDKAIEATAQAKQITSEMKKQGQAALKSSKDLTGTVKQGVINTSNSVANSVNNINTVNNNNNQPAPQFSEGTLAVMQGIMS